MVEAKLSTVTRENDKTSQVLNEKLDGINEAIARSQDTLERVKGEVVQVQKAQEELDQLKPVLKMLEHLPVRKAIVVDSRDPQQPQKAPELANNASEEERRIWARNRLKEIPFNLPNQ
jgi:archaellum component FlaC